MFRYRIFQFCITNHRFNLPFRCDLRLENLAGVNIHNSPEGLRRSKAQNNLGILDSNLHYPDLIKFSLKLKIGYAEI